MNNEVLRDEKATVWLCVRGHIDDHHLSIDGVDERCSRCGFPTVEYTLGGLAARLALLERRHRDT